MNEIDELQVGVALRDRLANEHPNLDGLATNAVAAGVRRQRRRRIASAAGAAAAVAGIATLTLTLGLGGGGTTQGTDAAASEPSTSPAAPSLQVGQKIDLGNGLTGTVRSAKDEALYHPIFWSMTKGSGTGFLLVADGPASRIQQWKSEGAPIKPDLPGITRAVTLEDADRLGWLGKVDKVPVTVPAGWTCEWYLVDDKADCSSTDGAGASLVIRDAKEHAAWSTSPDKGNAPGVYVTAVHKGIFISVQGDRKTSDAVIQDLGESLTWVK